MAVAEVSPGVTERQSSSGPPSHMRPSVPMPMRPSGSAHGPRPTLRGLGTFSLVLGIVLVLVSFGLFSADREMQRLKQEEARHDAQESGLLLDGRIALELEALGALRALFVSGDSASRERLQSLLWESDAVPRSARPGAERLWVIDSMTI